MSAFGWGRMNALAVSLLVGDEQTVGVTDHYADGTYLWWHLSDPSPELLQALTDNWLPPSGRAKIPSDTRLLDVLLVRLTA